MNFTKPSHVVAFLKEPVSKSEEELPLPPSWVARLLAPRSEGFRFRIRCIPPCPNFPNFAPKAKRLIYLHMNGAPSQLDLFDYKPGLQKLFDTDLPESIRKGQRITTMTSGQARLPVAPSIFGFKQCGKSGMWMSDLVPHMQGIADDIAMIKTVHTDAINHDPACTFVMTGSEIPGKPSLGSWISYGLGSESNDLPAFVVFTPTFPKESQAQALFTRMWSSGFLPTKYDGVALRGSGDPVLYVKNPPGVNRDDRRTMLDALGRLNQRNYERLGDPETQTRISQYEMAFRMQSSVPELADCHGESAATLENVWARREDSGELCPQCDHGPSARRAGCPHRADSAIGDGIAREPAKAHRRSVSGR